MRKGGTEVLSKTSNLREENSAADIHWRMEVILVAKIHYMLEQKVTAKLLAHQEDTNTLHSLEMEIRSSSDRQAGRRTTARYPRA
jgi:hypothetical protein